MELFPVLLNEWFLWSNPPGRLNSAFIRHTVCWIQPLLGTLRPNKWLKIFLQNFLQFFREKFVAGNQSFSINGGWKAGDKEDSIDAGALHHCMAEIERRRWAIYTLSSEMELWNKLVSKQSIIVITFWSDWNFILVTTGISDHFQFVKHLDY